MRTTLVLCLGFALGMSFRAEAAGSGKAAAAKAKAAADAAVQKANAEKEAADRAAVNQARAAARQAAARKVAANKFVLQANEALKTNDFDTALAHLKEAVKIDPENPSMFSTRGVIYMRKKDYDSAIADFSEVLRQVPTDYSALINRGISFRQKEDFKNAIADYSEAIRIAPKELLPTIYQYRGAAYSESEQPELAQSDAARAEQLKKQAAAAKSTPAPKK